MLARQTPSMMMMGLVMMAIMAQRWWLLLWFSQAKAHKGGSLTSDFTPISHTSQVLIESINRKRGRESPDARVKSAYVMTCSLAGWMNQAQSLITSSFLIISPHLTHCVPSSQSILCVRAWEKLSQSNLSLLQHVCYFTAILDNDLFYYPQLEGLPLEREW